MDKSEKILNATTIFALMSAYTYFVWFQFENGSCAHYKIPSYFISPSITGLLICLTAVISIVVSSFKLLGIATPLFQRMKDPALAHLHGIYFINGMLIIISVLVIYAFPFSYSILLGLVVLIIFINLLTWGLNYLWQIRQKKSFQEKIIEATTASKKDQLELFNLIEYRFSKNQIIFGAVLVVLPAITYILGLGNATSQNSYKLIANKNNIAILKKYDDVLLCRQIDTTRTFSDTLIVLRLTDTNEYLLTDYTGVIKMK